VLCKVASRRDQKVKALAMPFSAGCHSLTFNQNDYILGGITSLEGAIVFVEMIEGDIDKPFHFLTLLPIQLIVRSDEAEADSVRSAVGNQPTYGHLLREQDIAFTLVLIHLFLHGGI